MLRLYTQRAYTDIEMADRLGVDRTTVFRDRQQLEIEHPFIEVEEGRYQIDKLRYVSNIKLNRGEALTLYLSARRTSQQTRIAQLSTAGSLEKLAVTLQQPMTERLVKAADRILREQAVAHRTAVFEAVARAWIEGLSMRLDYRALASERVRTHRFDVYLIEPSPWSDGIYLIGFSDIARRIITLKLDRVEKAVLSSPFAVRPEFDEETMLKHAWGIWGSDRTPELVRLRFAPGPATRRLQETVWHPLEKVTGGADGGCIWEAPIAEWQEMLPWIRGWGAEVEVLAPVQLREALMGEARKLALAYGWQVESPHSNAGADKGHSSTLDDFFGG
jgi:CRISPR-associated endonuclease/helicase Cas3